MLMAEAISKFKLTKTIGYWNSNIVKKAILPKLSFKKPFVK